MKQTFSPADSPKAALKEKIIDVAEQLTANPEHISDFLRFQSKFYNYSINNAMLIYSQNPNAKYCGGFNFFNNKGYNIKKGSRGMKIFMPVASVVWRKGQDEDWQTIQSATKDDKELIRAGKYETRKTTSFKIGTVFDISQTTCPPEEYSKFFDVGYTAEQRSAAYAGIKKYCEQTLQIEPFEDNGNLNNAFSFLLPQLGNKILKSDLNAKSAAQNEFETAAFAVMLKSYLDIPQTDEEKNQLAVKYRAMEQFFEENPNTEQSISIGETLSNVSKAYADCIEDISHFISNAELLEKQAVQDAPQKEAELTPPYVKVLWSESPDIAENTVMSLFDAHNRFKELDEKYSDSEGYYKTKFQINLNADGNTYIGRQDFGDGDGGLIDHIEQFLKYDIDTLREGGYYTAEEAQETKKKYEELIKNLWTVYERENIAHCTKELELAKQNRDFPKIIALQEQIIDGYNKINQLNEPISDVSKVAAALNKNVENRGTMWYNNDVNKTERGIKNERYDRPSIRNERRGSTTGNIRKTERELSEGISEQILQGTGENRQAGGTSVGHRKTSDIYGTNLSKADGGLPRDNRSAESGRYDEMGRNDEQRDELSQGDSEPRSNIRLEHYDRSNEDKSLISDSQAEENKTSAFSFSQEIIDAVLTRGRGISEGKMRIYEQFEKSLSSKENAEFLKNEYGIGGSYPAIVGAGIDENHNGKGITLSRGFENDAPKLDLKWTQVERRIGELIKMDRYLNPKEKEYYPEWLEKQKERRAELAEERKNREILSTAPPEPNNQTEETPTDVRYEYHLGNKVYLGADEYEILSFDDDRVMLYDTQFPLFNKEFERTEFDRMVQENPMNDHLKVKELPVAEKADIITETVSNNIETEQQAPTQTGYEDAFFIDREKENITWMYYNPDSNAGGQYVTNTLSFNEVREAAQSHPTADDFFDYLGSIANQTLADVGTEWFEEADNAFMQTPDLTECTPETMQKLIEFAEPNATLEKDKIEKEPELIKPQWENKKSKVESFDLHPDIPMSERNTFDLRANPVEPAGKKERFRRNMEAINVLKECEFENRFATPDEQIILSKYVGWGGLSEAFDENNSAWADEFTELYTVLSPEEYAAARESTLTAFYTPPEVTDAIYKALEQMGFKEGNLLEPSCGIGNFIGMLPESMKNSKIYGVELDTISAGIAQQLYQKSSIAAQGFEEVNVPDSFFDGVIGNVPFGDFKVLDKRYDKHNFLIHDYFFAKSLDKLRPGGVMALITSKGTMDKENPSVRKYIAQRANLLGAIRLPNNTFKGNAGTEVVSDILILQKRDRIIDIEPDWVYLDKNENGITMNSYFVKHPEMILGEMKTVSGRFGPEATCAPFENADLSVLLGKAVSNIHGEIPVYEVTDEAEKENNSIPADPTVRNFSYTIVDDKIYFRENSRMTPEKVSAAVENRIKGMIGIRDCVRNLIELQTEDYPDDDIKQAQAKLNALYDSFTEKYGLINGRANSSAFGRDSAFSLLSSLEVTNENGEYERKADMFYKRTIKPHIPVTLVDTASEALAVSLGEKAGIDIEYMQQLTGKNEETLYKDLKGVIFQNPLYEHETHTQAKYLMADEYLSGNVREKLATAKRSAEAYPEKYKINVEALEKVQPKDLTASEISVRLGATWIPTEVVQQFMFEFLNTPIYDRWNIKVHFSPYTGEWNIEGKNCDQDNVKAYSTYGTRRINAYKIIEETLNLKDVRIFDYIKELDGKTTAELNKKETAIAQAKQELIKQGFQDWIWTDPDRREKLTKMYNEKFNSIRPREYDGSHIVFSGINPEITLREHQRNAVAHILYGGNTLLAHTVGAGKTFEMVAAAMESKRLGLCNKSLFVVPNHLTKQWAAEFLQLYPAANILVATKKDFETKNRKRFCGRIATGEYDAVIIGHSQFEKIPMSIERQRASLEQQLDELTDGIAELRHKRGENFSIKQLEKSKKAVKLKLQKLNDQSRKDDVVTFEELGVDRLFIDESHYYKNLYLYTKMRNVGGIAQTEAQKSSDLFMKCRYLDEITGGRGTVFATGTPISNSMVELYTIQRYLQYNSLVKNNLQYFDAWASTFGETITAVELTPEGTGYRAKTRFAKFYNLPELMSMFKEVADIKTADMLDLPVPKAVYHNISVKPSEIQKKIVASLAERAEKVRSGGVDSSVDNMLKITNDGRKLALDQRMLNDTLPDFKGSKVNVCVDNVFRIWEETRDKKSAQLVFCDLSTPKNDGTFSVYNDIRKKLIERGIPESEVRFIHEADTDEKKKELFQKTRKGEVRVLMGSTQKMGAGTNVQDKLIALHDIDCPWRPSDLEQRAGRIIRQGNSNPVVDIYRYVTEQTFDAYLYQLVEGKQKFASQIMTSKSPVRSAEDIDETALSYAEIKMLATGNPHIKEKMDLDIQVQKLRLLKSNFLSEKYALEDRIVKYYPKQIQLLNLRIDGLTDDVKTAEEHPKNPDDQFVGISINGKNYFEKEEAGKAIIEACKQMQNPEPKEIGEYRGFKLKLLFDTVEREYKILLKGRTAQQISIGQTLYGNITRLDNAVDKFAIELIKTQNDLAATCEQFETAKKEIEKPFSAEKELDEKTARLNELNALLNIDSQPAKSEVKTSNKAISDYCKNIPTSHYTAEEEREF